MQETPGPQRTGVAAMWPGPTELEGMVRLALPVAGVQVGMMAMGVADTIMVGQVSAEDLAGIALGNMYFFASIVFGMGVLMALDPVISQAVGARDPEGVSRGLQRGGLLALILSLASSAVLVPGDWVLTALRQPPEVVPVAAGYALASIPGVFPFLAFIVLRQTLQAMGRVAPIVWTIVGANAVNLVLNWVLIFGNLGAPRLGAVGSAWGSSISRWLMALALLWMAWPLLGRHLHPVRRDTLVSGPLIRMVRLGTPIGIQLGLEFGAFIVVAILMGWMGTVAVASHQVAINLASLTFMVPLGISQASAVLVGRAVGRSDTPGARRAAGAGLILSGAIMVVTAAVFLTFPELLAGVYSTDAGVVALAASLIPIAGIFQIVDGLQVAASGILRGAGDTKGPMKVNVLGFWLVGMPVSLALGFGTPLGPRGLWWGLAVGLGAVAFFLLLRIRSRFSRELSRVVIDADEAAPEPRPAEALEETAP